MLREHDLHLIFMPAIKTVKRSIAFILDIYKCSLEFFLTDCNEEVLPLVRYLLLRFLRWCSWKDNKGKVFPVHIKTFLIKYLAFCTEVNWMQKWQSYPLAETESEKFNGNVAANPKYWFHRWNRQKRIMKDSSSLIIVKSFKQFAPYAYHPVLVILNPAHSTLEKIENAA